MKRLLIYLLLFCMVAGPVLPSTDYSHSVPSADNTLDLGSASKEWKDLYIDGVANIDSLIADTMAGTVVTGDISFSPTSNGFDTDFAWKGTSTQDWSDGMKTIIIRDGINTLVIKNATDNFFVIDPTPTPHMFFGNPVDNPDYEFLGNGSFFKSGSGSTTLGGVLMVQGDTLTLGDNTDTAQSLIFDTLTNHGTFSYDGSVDQFDFDRDMTTLAITVATDLISAFEFESDVTITDPDLTVSNFRNTFQTIYDGTTTDINAGIFYRGLTVNALLNTDITAGTSTGASGIFTHTGMFGSATIGGDITRAISTGTMRMENIGLQYQASVSGGSTINTNTNPRAFLLNSAAIDVESRFNPTLVIGDRNNDFGIFGARIGVSGQPSITNNADPGEFELIYYGVHITCQPSAFTLTAGGTNLIARSYGIYNAAVGLASLQANADVETYGYYQEAITGVSDVNYGMKLEAVSGATVNWALAIAGGNSYHVGNLRLGDTTVPTDMLEVNGVSVFGDGGTTNYLQISATGDICLKGTAVNIGQGVDTDLLVLDGATSLLTVNGDVHITEHLGVGIGVGTENLIRAAESVTTTGPIRGVLASLSKVGGATDQNDEIVGLRGDVELDQAGGAVGNMYGVSGLASITDGDVGVTGNPRHLYGVNSTVDLFGGKIWGNAYAVYAEIDQAGGNEIAGNAYGTYIDVDLDGTFGGVAYMLYLDEGSNIDFGIYQAGTAVNYLQGDTGINTSTPDTKLQVVGTSGFGDDAGNETLISATGLQTMAGTARVLRSIDLEPVLATRPSANPPGEGLEAGFPTHDFNASTDESVYFHLELSHDYAAAGLIHVHFDFFVDTAPASAESVVWGVEYQKQSIGDNFNFSSTTIAYTQTSITTGTPANDKKTHESAEVSLVTTGFVAGDYILLRLFRDADGTGGTDDYTTDARVLDYHIEYLSDKIGEGT